ncbi:hypothetical protein [Lentzea sp. CA-135723]|uniref:hypothetical protein n=1 Tax=Lentzea sp. CA-135723 TaxID=3239950 RepID=UPI003D917098
MRGHVDLPANPFQHQHFQAARRLRRFFRAAADSEDLRSLAPQVRPGAGRPATYCPHRSGISSRGSRERERKRRKPPARSNNAPAGTGAAVNHDQAAKPALPRILTHPDRT